jgi:hypothetical protein
MNDRPLPLRALLLAPGGFALLAGLDAALMLLGVPAPIHAAARLTEVHGVLLVLGFVGTVIALERAVAARHPWGYLAPAFLGAGAVLLVTPAPRSLGSALLVAGSATLVAVYASLWRRAADVAVLIQAAGAVLATGGALLWLGGVPVPDLLPWLSGFLFLTIAGERLELARVAMLGTRAEAALTALTAVAAAMVAATVATMLWPGPGYPLLGAALLAAVAWLGRFDVALRTVRATGLTRYMAVCLLAGYVWLLVPGWMWLLAGRIRDGAGYDAVVHAVMLGFVLSMIMAHAPVILPAVVRRPLPYTRVMYAPVALLHGSLLLRLAVGDARGVAWAVQWGGVLNIVAVLGFIAVAGYSAARAGSRVPA